MRNARSLVAVALAAAALLVAGCGGGDDGSADTVPATATELFVVSPYLSTFPDTKALVDDFVAQATKAGYKVDPPVDTAGDVERVSTEIQNAVTAGADAIVIGQGDPSKMTAGLQAAKAANITSDNGSLGDIAAQALATRIGEGGKVVMIHYDGFPPLAARAAAAKARLEKSGITVLDYVQGDLNDPTNAAKAIAAAALAKYPVNEINGIWAAWDAAGLGAYQATQEAARPDVLIASVDGQDTAKGPIGEGTNWIATVRQDWANVAKTAVDTIDSFYQGTAIDQTILVPGKLVTKDDAGS